MAEDELTTLEKLRSCWLLMILTLRLLVTITRTLTFSMYGGMQRAAWGNGTA